MDKNRIFALLLASGMTMSMLSTPALAALKDTEGNWAEQSIVRWNEYGVLNGDGNGNFNPSMMMTRAQFATMLVNLMGYTDRAPNSFADVEDDAWYADAILKLAAAGIMQGDDGNARPNAPITRQAAAAMLCRALHLEPLQETSSQFQDVADSSWAAPYIAALHQRGMIQGIDGQNFAPTMNITRAAVAKILDNMVGVYVTKDNAVVTGPQKGVVIVAAKDVKVADATLTDSLIVVPSASGVIQLESVTAGNVIMSAEGGTLKVDKNTRLETVSVTAPKVVASVEGQVGKLEISADNVEIDGHGTIKHMTFTGGKNVTVDKATTVEKVDNMGDKPVEVGGQIVRPNESVSPTPGGTRPTPGSGSSSGVRPTLKTPAARFSAAAAEVDFNTEYTFNNNLILEGVTYSGAPLTASVTGGEGVTASLTATSLGNTMLLEVIGEEAAASGTYQMTFTIPADALTAKDGYKTVTEDMKVTFTLTIKADPNRAPDLSGTSKVVIKGKENADGARVGDTLTVTSNQLSGTTTSLHYLWQRNGVDIPGAEGTEYTAVAADYNKVIKCVITSGDAEGSVEAAATGKLGKAVGPAAPAGLNVTDPVRKGGKGSITGVNATMEYVQSNEGAPRPDASGTGIIGDKLELPAGTYYVRIKATETVEAGVWSEAIVINEAPAYNATINSVKVQDVVSSNGSVTVNVTGTNLDADTDNWSDVKIGLSTKPTGATADDFTQLASALTATSAGAAAATISNVTSAGIYYVYYTVDGSNWTTSDEFVVIGAKVAEASLSANQNALKLTNNGTGLSDEGLARLTVLKSTGKGESLKHELVAAPQWRHQTDSIAYLIGLTGGTDVKYTVVAADGAAAGENFAAIAAKSAELTMGSRENCTAAMLTGGNVEPGDVALFNAEGTAAGSVVGETGKVVVTGLEKDAAYTYYVTGDGVTAEAACVSSFTASGGETGLNIYTSNSLALANSSQFAVLKANAYQQLANPMLLKSSRYLDRDFLIGTGFTCEAGEYTVVTTFDMGDDFTVQAKKLNISSTVDLGEGGNAIMITGTLAGMTPMNTYVYSCSNGVEVGGGEFYESNGQHALITTLGYNSAFIVVTETEGKVTSLVPGVSAISDPTPGDKISSLVLQPGTATYGDGCSDLNNYMVLRKRGNDVNLVQLKQVAPEREDNKISKVFLHFQNSDNKMNDIFIVFVNEAAFTKMGTIQLEGFAVG